MFRVEKEEYVNKTFRLPKKLMEEMEILAALKNISLNKLVIKCCQYAMDNLEEKDG